MTAEFISLFVIACAAGIAPLLSRFMPRRSVPEAVFLLTIGAIFGPHVLQLIHLSHSIDLLGELGLAFLFLLAGYELHPSHLFGKTGLVAGGTWLVSVGIALAAVAVLPFASLFTLEGWALTIAMTSTALGTLMPILRERGMMKTPVGHAVLAHGAYGELGPVLAMAVLMSTRDTWKTFLILGVFFGVAGMVAALNSRIRSAGRKLVDFIHLEANTTAQATIRLTVIILVGLMTLAAVFNLDVVLGAFAAGFVLRAGVPQGSYQLEQKLDGLAYGFFIPLFFVVSGARIDLKVIDDRPLLLFGFTGMLLVVRAIPVFLSNFITAEGRSGTTLRQKVTIALYSTTALPIIVAVTHLAVKMEVMSEANSSILVTAGALTVVLMPLLTSFSCSVVDTHPITAMEEIMKNPSRASSILRQHWAAGRQVSDQLRAERRKLTLERRARIHESIVAGDDAWIDEVAAESTAWVEETRRTVNDQLDSIQLQTSQIVDKARRGEIALDENVAKEAHDAVLRAEAKALAAVDEALEEAENDISDSAAGGNVDGLGDNAGKNILSGESVQKDGEPKEGSPSN